MSPTTSLPFIALKTYSPLTPHMCQPHWPTGLILSLPFSGKDLALLFWTWAQIPSNMDKETSFQNGYLATPFFKIHPCPETQSCGLLSTIISMTYLIEGCSTSSKSSSCSACLKTLSCINHCCQKNFTSPLYSHQRNNESIVPWSYWCPCLPICIHNPLCT